MNEEVAVLPVVAFVGFVGVDGKRIRTRADRITGYGETKIQGQCYLGIELPDKSGAMVLVTQTIEEIDEAVSALMLGDLTIAGQAIDPDDGLRVVS